MLNLNAFAISNLFIIALLFPFSVFLLIAGKTKVAKLYLLSAFSALIWGTGAFFAARI